MEQSGLSHFMDNICKRQLHMEEIHLTLLLKVKVRVVNARKSEIYIYKNLLDRIAIKYIWYYQDISIERLYNENGFLSLNQMVAYQDIM